MPAALIALAAIQTGYSIWSQQEQMRAAKKAQRQADDQAIANQNKLVQDEARKRREQGTVLGGFAGIGADSASQRGTLLTSSSNKRSLLG